MSGADHVWEKRGERDVCARCGGMYSSRYIALTPCSGELPSEPHDWDGWQSPTSEELEIDRLRLEVSELTSLADAREVEVDRLRRLVTAAAAALDGLLDTMEARGFPVHLLISYHLRRMARDLRAVLDQGAPR